MTYEEQTKLERKHENEVELKIVPFIWLCHPVLKRSIINRLIQMH